MQTAYEAKQAQLKARVAHTIQILGYTEFTAKNVAGAMFGADKYDVLFALHALKNEGVVTQITSREEVFADRWQRVRPVTKYVYSPVQTQAVASAL